MKRRLNIPRIGQPLKPDKRALLLRGSSPMALQAQIAANVNQRLAREKPKET